MIKADMENNIPAKLYKYGCKIEYLKEILLDNKILLYSPFDFNDPFELRPRLDVGNTQQELEGTHKSTRRYAKKKYKTLDEKSIRAEAERIVKRIQQSPVPMNEYTHCSAVLGFIAYLQRKTIF